MKDKEAKAVVLSSLCWLEEEGYGSGGSCVVFTVLTGGGRIRKLRQSCSGRVTVHGILCSTSRGEIGK